VNMMLVRGTMRRQRVVTTTFCVYITEREKGNGPSFGDVWRVVVCMRMRQNQAKAEDRNLGKLKYSPKEGRTGEGYEKEKGKRSGDFRNIVLSQVVIVSTTDGTQTWL
jgi:hypothetical protein